MHLFTHYVLYEVGFLCQPIQQALLASPEDWPSLGQITINLGICGQDCEATWYRTCQSRIALEGAADMRGLLRASLGYGVISKHLVAPVWFHCSSKLGRSPTFFPRPPLHRNWQQGSRGDTGRECGFHLWPQYFPTVGYWEMNSTTSPSRTSKRVGQSHEVPSQLWQAGGSHCLL